MCCSTLDRKFKIELPQRAKKIQVHSTVMGEYILKTRFFFMSYSTSKLKRKRTLKQRKKIRTTVITHIRHPAVKR